MTKKKKSENTETKILKLFGNDTEKQFSFDKLKELLPKSTRREKLIHALLVLKKQNRILEVEMDLYQLNEPEKKQQKVRKEVPENKIKVKHKSEELEGIIDISSSGAIFVILEEFEKDPILRENNLPVFSGDRVRIRINKSKEGKRPEATFLKVIERKQKTFIAKFSVHKSKEYEVYFASPMSFKIPYDFYISSKHINNAKDGDFIEIEFLEWTEGEKNPRGKVIEVLKNFNPNELTMRSILLEREFHQDFPEQVIEELKPISSNLSKSDLEDRLDLRDVLTLTIDPKTAKDFDDALSVKKLENEQYQIGVHIADVAHYVKQNTELDKEALRRATSVYLPDRVAPMLPEKLSNDLCSLNPNVDRLAFSMIYTVDENGKIESEFLAKTIIHSDKRFTYEDAQKIIETKNGEHSESVLLLHNIASHWRKKRFEKGSINFAASEVQFVLDKKGKPIDIIPKIQKEANWLVEEFMLRANISIAKALDVYTKKKKIPAGVYRNHDIPNLEKLEQFRESALRLGGHELKKFEKVEQAASTINNFLSSIKDLPEAEILNQMAIRSMAKAYYSTDNIGHYGLAFSHYSHFTSPIRRYPDLIAHRLLTNLLRSNKINETKSQLEEMCIHCSDQERKAIECEREGIKYKQTEYLSYHLKEKFEGIISGMNGNGFWVELKDNRCEGYVELSSNFKELFSFDQNALTLTSKESHSQFHIGQPVLVLVEKVELDSRRVWLKYLDL